MIKIKKIIIGLLLVVFSISNTSAYTASDWFNIYYQGNASRQDIYIVPDGKDLVINFLYSDQVTKSEMFFRDNGIDIAGGEFIEHKNQVFLVIKDLLQLRDGSALNNYTLTGFLVDEEEDIENYIDGTSNAWNKNIFTLYDLEYIYTIEMAFMILAMMWIFFTRTITGTKGPFKI